MTEPHGMAARGPTLDDPDAAHWRPPATMTDPTALALAEAASRAGDTADAAADLGTSLDERETVRAIARTAVPELADWAVVDLLDETGRLERVGIAHVDPALQAAAEEVDRRWPPDPWADAGPAAVARGADTLLIPVIRDEDVAAVAPDPAYLEAWRAFAVTSCVAVPLGAPGESLGVLTLFRGRSRPAFGPPDLPHAEALGRRAGAALENARRYARERAAHAAAEAARRRTEQLQRLSADLTRERTTDEVAAVVMAHLATSLGAGAGVLVLDAHGSRWGGPRADADERVAALAAPLEVPGPAREAARTRAPVYVPSAAAWTARFGTAPPPCTAEAAVTGWAALPLVVDARLVGILTVGVSAPAPFAADDRRFLQTCADLCAQALARARTLEALRDSERQLREALAAERAARERTEHLQALTRALAAARTAPEVAQVIATDACRAVGATAAHVRLAAADEATGETLVVDGGVARDAGEAAPAHARADTPLVAGDGAVLGTVEFAFAAGEVLDASRQAWLQTVAQQCSEALDRAHLDAAERAGHARADALQQCTARLAQARTLAEIGQLFSAELARLVDAELTWVGILDDTGTHLEALGWHGYTDAEAAQWHHTPLDAAIAIADVVRRGEPQWWSSRAELADAYPARRRIIEAVGQDAVALLPLIDERTGAPDGRAGAARAIGGMAIGFRERRRFTAPTRAFLEALARQCAQAIDRARAYEAERAAREAAEAARHEAEAASRAKSEFLAVMSHELRTPLNAIGGHTELVALGIHGPVTAAQQEALARVQRSQRHLLGLIDEVLNYARLEAGVVRYEVARVPLDAALAGLVPLVAPLAAAKAITLDVVQPPPALAALADADKLTQILLNLLSNAVKFTPAGGRIAVRCVARTDAVDVQVEDSGVGILAADIPRIFEPFVQVGRAFHAPGAGTGLGLAISRDLAQGMGGALAVESTPGVGSVFTLSLPTA